MALRHSLLFVILLGNLLASAATAPAGAGSLRDLVAQCRGDYDRLCSGVKPGGGRILACLDKHSAQLSRNCLLARRQYSGEPATTAGNGVKVVKDLAYGGDPAQRLDVYFRGDAKRAPVILMVHGGGWRFGDKASRSVVDNKVAHWVPKGAIFISVNNRLLPAADPVKQASDVARALAFAQSKARSWGGDPGKFVLMGHSAGAHLVSLITADPDMAYRLGAKPWLGTVSLDSTAMDVVRLMTQRHPRYYNLVFGNDPDYWHRASPARRLDARPKPMLLVCSSRRDGPCPQAHAFAEKADGQAEVMPVPMSHGAINHLLGTESEYTRAVDAFLERIGAR